jgi:hypothetical protein
MAEWPRTTTSLSLLLKSLERRKKLRPPRAAPTMGLPLSRASHPTPVRPPLSASASSYPRVPLAPTAPPHITRTSASPPPHAPPPSPPLFPFARRHTAHSATASFALAQPPPLLGRVPSRQRLQSSEWSSCAPSLRRRLHPGFSLDPLLEIHRSIGGDDGLELLRTPYVPRECPHEIHRPTSAREATSISSGGRLHIGHLHYLLQSPTAREGTSPGMCLTAPSPPTCSG